MVAILPVKYLLRVKKDLRHNMQQPHGSFLMYEINASSALRIMELPMNVSVE
jgi:hypothetical protein